MYFKDLTKNYGTRVGWLALEHPFPTGEMDPLLIRELVKAICGKHVNQMRGYHFCEFCPRGYFLHTVSHQGKRSTMGSAEIAVRSKGANYQAPTLILHYVIEHNYLPPQGFLDALAARRTDAVRLAELQGPYLDTWKLTKECEFSKEDTIKELEQITGMRMVTDNFTDESEVWAAWLAQDPVRRKWLPCSRPITRS